MEGHSHVLPGQLEGVGVMTWREGHSHILCRQLEGVRVSAGLVAVLGQRVALHGFTHVVDAEGLHESLQDVHHAGPRRQIAQLANTAWGQHFKQLLFIEGLY